MRSAALAGGLGVTGRDWGRGGGGGGDGDGGIALAHLFFIDAGDGFFEEGGAGGTE